jgi:alpha-glucosidase (family GH31 glycosyl hydrolase)
MLKHLPKGLGHPYRTEPFERTPHFPTLDSNVILRVCSDQKTASVKARIDCGDICTDLTMKYVGNAISTDKSIFGITAKELMNESHLEDAAARSGEYSEWKQWEIQIPQGIITGDFSYSFFSSEESEVFSVLISKWEVSSDLKITKTGSAKELISPEWLLDSSGKAHALRFAIKLNENVRVVGFGERFHAVDQVGENIDAVVYEEYKGQGHRTYLPTPFLNLIGSNFGLHINTANPSRFSVGTVDPGFINVQIDLDSNEEEIEINFYDGNPVQVLNSYLEQVGKPSVPPAWVYSLWISSNEWNTQARVVREVQECFDSGIKPGVVVIEAWSDESTFTVFRDAQYRITNGKDGLSAKEISYPVDGAWPDPSAMIDDLHLSDIRLILWQIPIIKEEGSRDSQSFVNWHYAIDNDMLIKDELGQPYKVRGFWFRDGLLPDLTSEKVRKWWAEQRRYLVSDLGVDGFKTDGGEHAWGQDLLYLDGKSGLQKNNLFPVAYARTFHELLSENDKAPVTFSRSGFSGSQQFPTFWAGDENSTWAAYRASINAGITASASGFFHWGWDIGGFSGDIPSPELYLRGAAMAAFCPIMQIHSEFNHHKIPSNDRTPWNLARRYDDATIVETFRGFTTIRENLMSYIVSEGEYAIQSGRPLMAGLFFDYFEDLEIWKAPHQYMFGRSLLISPVTLAGAGEWSTYLPEGEWINAWTGESHTGSAWVTVDAPITQIPIFIKSNDAKLLLNHFKI